MVASTSHISSAVFLPSSSWCVNASAALSKYGDTMGDLIVEQIMLVRCSELSVRDITYRINSTSLTASFLFHFTRRSPAFASPSTARDGGSTLTHRASVHEGNCQRCQASFGILALPGRGNAQEAGTLGVHARTCIGMCVHMCGYVCMCVGL